MNLIGVSGQNKTETIIGIHCEVNHGSQSQLDSTPMLFCN
jgi:hypothetical protein